MNDGCATAKLAAKHFRATIMEQRMAYFGTEEQWEQQPDDSEEKIFCELKCANHQSPDDTRTVTRRRSRSLIEEY
jgi:hypothetical protein